MIQIYQADNTNYDFNGDAVIKPTKCLVEMELNGSWEMELQHPIDEEGNWQLITEGSVIFAPTPVGEKQLFRIYRKIKNDTSVKAYARPIFFDAANDAFLVDVRPTNKKGQEALSLMVSGTMYTASTNITKSSTAYYIRKNLVEAISGSDENAFLNRWGGEIIYNNYKIIINERAGGDYGVKAMFGRNLTGIEEDVNMDSVVTRIVPVAYNGYTLAGSKPWVDSPNINKYPIIYTKEVKFEDIKLTADASDDDEVSYATIAELRTALTKACNEMFSEGADVPAINYQCNMVDLSKTEEYRDFELLETIGLGDTITCRNQRIGIETKARAVKITYDCVNQKNVEIELGDFKENFFNNLSSVYTRVDKAITSNGVVRAEQIQGILDGMNTVLRAQKDVAQKQEVRAILFEDLDETSPTYGAMCLGTQGFQIGRVRTADNKDWDWETFGTAQGFSANLILTGMLVSQNYMKNVSGLLMDLEKGTIDSKNFKVDENGNVTFSGSGTFAGTVNSSSANITGGSFKVTTSSSTDSRISLSYGNYNIKMAPYAIEISSNLAHNGKAAYAWIGDMGIDYYINGKRALQIVNNFGDGNSAFIRIYNSSQTSSVELDYTKLSKLLALI